MADPTAFLPNPETESLPISNPPLLSEHWEAEFSRVFIVPREHSSAVDPALRPLSKSTSPYRRGSWLTSSSPATILIAKAASHAPAILSVSVSGFVHEEHLVSSLRLTWPQIACEPMCPTRGSRVVFMSYNDSSNQLQKFAVRFQSSAGAANFISFFKDSSRDTIDVVAPASDFMCDSSSPSEMIASHTLQYKFDEGRSYEESADRDESHRLPLLLVNKDINNTTFSHAPPASQSY
ncbi:hypothetical protein KSP40_PGU010930 [Platanthera guangdongensis]|uniref:Poor homologous synapsis 1 PH domain-containing protein n=1 Tax=Platanthera guangdongensis TaxID=2320717 RepID=A0ABR2LF52_9ASPA